MTEAKAMVRALELALRGWGQVSPNPLVGAVLLRDGAVVGEGFHSRFGAPHAEVAALGACEDPLGTTCVVTLEPCAHEGQTPPCVDALIAAGVTRVVIAGRDPHPVAAGGIDRLRHAGIEVVVGVETRAAAALNAPFLVYHRRPARPFVAVKVGTSLDGFIADAAGRSRWITGETAREHVQWLRAGFDAIGVGRRTAEADNPRLTVRGAVQPRVPPRRVIFGRTGGLPATHDLLGPDGAPAVLFVSPGEGDRITASLTGTAAEVREATDLEDALEQLAAAGITSILIEGGGALNGALLSAGLVDRVYWFQAPRWLGKGTPAFGPQEATPLAEADGWEVTERRVVGPDTLLVVDRELCLLGS